jgi:hypothetical protein
MEKKMAHSVYFWLRKDLNPAEKRTFEEHLASLKSIKSVQSCHIGTPSPTERPVIDRSYDYNLLCLFRNREEHDLYQEDPVHLAFKKICGPLWEKVVIYDSDAWEPA